MFDTLINNIGFSIFQAIWALFCKLPMLLLNLVQKAYNILALELPMSMLFGIKPGQGFEEASIPTLFTRLAIISVVVFGIMFLVSIIKAGTYNPSKEQNPLVGALKYSAIGSLFIIMIPLVLFGFLMIINGLISLILGSELQPLSNIIWSSLYNPIKYSDITQQAWDAQPIQNADGLGSWTPNRGFWDNLPNGGGWEIAFIFFLVLIVTLIPLALGALTLVQKIFQQLVLFIISPFVAASGVADEGKRLRLWKDQFIAKSFVIVGFVLGIQIFSVFVNLSLNSINQLSPNDFFLKLLLMIAIFCGGAIAATNLSQVFASFLGESASVRETLGETRGLITGIATGAAAAKGAGKFVKKAAQGSVNASAKVSSKLASAGSKLASNLGFGGVANKLSGASRLLGGYVAGTTAAALAAKASNKKLSGAEKARIKDEARANYNANEDYKEELVQQEQEILNNTNWAELRKDAGLKDENFTKNDVLSQLNSGEAKNYVEAFYARNKDNEKLHKQKDFAYVQALETLIDTRQERKFARNPNSERSVTKQIKFNRQKAARRGWSDEQVLSYQNDIEQQINTNSSLSEKQKDEQLKQHQAKVQNITTRRSYTNFDTDIRDNTKSNLVERARYGTMTESDKAHRQKILNPKSESEK